MKAHFADNYLINPRHPLTVHLVGAGGTGSQVLNALARIDYALFKLQHPGLQVTVYDDDIVTEANIGRQLFCPCDIGQDKASVLVSRVNSFFGLNWESVCAQYPQEQETANIVITCVDNVKSRIAIGKHLERNKNRGSYGGYDQSQCLYWLDFGNQRDRGQVILGSIRDIEQPKKSKYETVGYLPTVDKFFDLTQVDEAESGPSCSLAEALQKQDLFINSTLAQLGCALLWKLITEGSITTNGLYLNLSTMKVNPIKL